MRSRLLSFKRCYIKWIVSSRWMLCSDERVPAVQCTGGRCWCADGGILHSNACVEFLACDWLAQVQVTILEVTCITSLVFFFHEVPQSRFVLLYLATIWVFQALDHGLRCRMHIQLQSTRLTGSMLTQLDTLTWPTLSIQWHYMAVPKNLCVCVFGGDWIAPWCDSLWCGGWSFCFLFYWWLLRIVWDWPAKHGGTILSYAICWEAVTWPNVELVLAEHSHPGHLAGISGVPWWC